MELLRTLLDQPHICVITRQPDVEMRQIQDTIEHKALVEGRADLEALFSGLLAYETRQRAQDAGSHRALHRQVACSMLGDWVIDAERPGVTSYFRELADNDVLPRLGINAVRLLGCHTAGNAKTRSTIRTLTEILGRRRSTARRTSCFVGTTTRTASSSSGSTCLRASMTSVTGRRRQPKRALRTTRAFSISMRSPSLHWIPGRPRGLFAWRPTTTRGRFCG